MANFMDEEPLFYDSYDSEEIIDNRVLTGLVGDSVMRDWLCPGSMAEAKKRDKDSPLLSKPVGKKSKNVN